MTKSSFDQLLVDAEASIDEGGELPYPVRRRLRLALECLDGSVKSISWVQLEVICARHVSPIWQSRFPDEDRPIRLVDQAGACLEASARPEDLRRALGETKTLLDNKFELGDQFFSAIYAGFACWAAARDVFFGSPTPKGESELEFGPEEWDASFYGSMAFSGGAVWEEGVGSVAKRREYWEWFLHGGLGQIVGST